MEITRKEAREIMAAAKLALEPVLKKYDMDFGRSGARFGSGSISVKFEFLKAGAKEVIANARAASYQIPFKAGDRVVCGTKQYTVDSITPRGSVIIKADSGKLFRAKPQGLKAVVDEQNVPRPLIILAHAQLDEKPEGGVFGMGRRPVAQILADFKDLECRLSPENLTCDGELSNSQVAQKYRELKRKRALLVEELGRQPTELNWTLMKVDSGGEA